MSSGQDLRDVHERQGFVVAQESDMAETKIPRRRWHAGLIILAAFLSLVLSERPVRAADAPGAECLACHGDKSTTTTRAGKTVSLYVDGRSEERPLGRKNRV